VHFDGRPSLCYDCKTLDRDDGEVTSDKLIRCPKCGHQYEAYVDCDDARIMSDGEHDVLCPKCDHEFEIVTHVSFCFQSPAREIQP
jgi:uncharacterized C2H2 Zn-finger protein